MRRLLSTARDFTFAGIAYGRGAWIRLRRWSPRPAEHAECRRVPVVVLPGILEPWTFLAPLERWLADQGHPVHVVRTLRLNLASLTRSVERCRAFLEAEDLDEVVLVAHSKGGLIGKALMLDDVAGPRIDGMVALASPFSGSTLARSIHRLPLTRRTPLGLFNPDGPEIASLHEQADVNARIVSLSPAWDQMVPGGSTLDGATNLDLATGGHFRPLTDQRVWNLIHHHVHALADAA